MSKSTRRMRRGAVGVLLLADFAACSSACTAGPASPLPARWTQVRGDQLATAPARPLAAAVEAGGDGRPWLIGGVVTIPETTHTEGLVTTSELRQVAIWQAASPSGPWVRARMDAVPGRDGPNETILYFAGSGLSAVAFGSRASPTEGYPRPSAWTGSSSSWTEVAEDREVFGGPNIVGYGGMAHGPHGFFLAGTWSDSHGHAEASVWASTDGSGWARVSDPSFEGAAGETPLGEGLADGPDGILLAATAEVPTRKNPTMTHGALWYSRTGRGWTRLSAPGLTGSETTARAIVTAGSGWLVVGTVGRPGHQDAAVWQVSPRLKVGRPEILPGTGTAPLAVTSAQGDRSQVVVAGVAGGRPVIWVAPLGPRGAPTGWRLEQTPPTSVADLQQVTVSVGTSGTIIALVGKTDSQVWHT